MFLLLLRVSIYLSIFLYVLTPEGDIRRVPVNQVLGVSFFSSLKSNKGPGLLKVKSCGLQHVGKTQPTPAWSKYKLKAAVLVKTIYLFVDSLSNHVQKCSKCSVVIQLFGY